MSEAEAIVQRQVEAFNAHDLDGFCACYSDDVVVLDGSGDEMLRGMEAFRERYRHQFRADAAGEVHGRLSAGSWVVDHETAQIAGQSLEGLVVYHVRDEVIDRVHFLFDAA